MQKMKFTIAIAALVMSTAAYSDIISIDSRAGMSCEYGEEYAASIERTPTGGDSCETVAITPHSAWMSNNPYGSEAIWVSYADTGIEGSDTPLPSPDYPVFSITETFTIGANGSLEFRIWADDTAGVLLSLDGETIEYIEPNTSQGTCAVGSIGCEPREFGSLSLALDPGTYDLRMDIYQVGSGTTASSNPFGVLYTGTATSVPEPGTLALLGLGLLGIGVARRKA